MEKRWDPMLWDTFAEAVQTEQLAPKYHSLASVLPYPCFSAAWAQASADSQRHCFGVVLLHEGAEIILDGPVMKRRFL